MAPVQPVKLQKGKTIMTYCPYCGTEVTETMSYCPNCGAPLTSSNAVTSYTSYSTPQTVTASGDYRVYITSLGTARKADITDLLEDTLGYSSALAADLLNNTPVQIAGNLSLQQAAVLAQAFEEYGVELSVTNGDEITDIASVTSSSSLFNSDGSFLASAAAILATLGVVNRLTTINKPKKPGILDRIFHSLFHVRRKPPVHVRRTIRPRPVVQPPRRAVVQYAKPSGRIPRNGHPGTSPRSSMGPGRSHGHSGNRGPGKHH